KRAPLSPVRVLRALVRPADLHLAADDVDRQQPAAAKAGEAEVAPVVGDVRRGEEEAKAGAGPLEDRAAAGGHAPTPRLSLRTFGRRARHADRPAPLPPGPYRHAMRFTVMPITAASMQSQTRPRRAPSAALEAMTADAPIPAPASTRSASGNRRSWLG